MPARREPDMGLQTGHATSYAPRAPTRPAASVSIIERPRPAPVHSPKRSAGPPSLDDDSRAWLSALRAEGPRREEATRRLRDLLLRATHFEINRRRRSLPHLRGGDLEDIAEQSANDALIAVLRRLDDFRGESRFTTWAYKFALLESAVALRRRAWQGREIVLEPNHWEIIGAARGPSADVEIRETLDAVGVAIDSELTPYQREVLVAVALNGVPIDVLAERLGTTRGALYKTIHDARRKLRAHLSASGLGLEAEADHETGRG